MSKYRECSELYGLTGIESIVVGVDVCVYDHREYVKFFCLNTPKEIVNMSYICDFDGNNIYSIGVPELSYSIRKGISDIFVWGSDKSGNELHSTTTFDDFDKVVKTLDIVKEFNKRHKTVFPKRPLPLYNFSDKAIIIY